MAFGKSIRIYLKDGTVTGIRYGEIFNHTILSIACPRTRISELRLDDNAKKPALYFLFGSDETTGGSKAYIGEAENVYDRLQSHLANKDFWNEVIVFVNKDDNLSKSHVKYLESKAIQLSKTSGRYKIENENDSHESLLSLPDRDNMEEFMIHVKLLLGVFGHKLLEETTPKVSQSNDIAEVVPKASSLDKENNVRSIANKELELYLSVGNLKAHAILTDEGLVVLEGSEASMEIKQSLQNGYREIRDRLINNGTLKVDGSKYIFVSKYLFDTPSPAAAIIVGYSINGREHWVDKSGRPLNVIEREQVK